MRCKILYNSNSSRIWWTLSLLVLLLTLGANPAYSQWTTNGNDINNTNSGRVGISTSSPQTKLHVEGGIYSSGAVDAGYSSGFRLVVTGVGDTRAIWNYYGGSATNRLTGGPNIRTSLGSNGIDDRLFLDTNGNVGINVTSPSSKLHLRSGTDSATSFLSLDTGIHGGSSFTVGGTANNESTFDLSVYRAGVYSSRLGVNSAGHVYLQPGGSNYVGIGTTSPTSMLHVVGNVTVTGNIAAKYQDVAEWVESSQELAPGTVVVLDHTRSNQVVASTTAYDTRVAGVVSERPGIALGESGDNKLLVATTGRVRIKVDTSNGPIQVGDLLVTSNGTGIATKSIPIEVGGVQIHRPGTLIGKALEPLASGQGEILVLLSLQ